MKFDPKVPPSLLALQKWFVKFETRLLRKSGELKIPLYTKKQISEIEQKITPGPKLSAAQRVGLYNQQYWWRFFTLLQEKFPCLHRLFGAYDFNRSIAEPFLRQYPSDHWSLSFLGSRLPLWMEMAYEDEDRHLVLPVAQLDEAYERLWYAPVLPPIQKGEENEKLFLQPFVSLFALEADFFSFRKQVIAHDPKHWEENDFPLIVWSKSSRYYVLWYRDGNHIDEEISSSEYRLLKAFQSGATIVDACVDSSQEDAAHIASWFEKWAKRGWLTTKRDERSVRCSNTG